MQGRVCIVAQALHGLRTQHVCQRAGELSAWHDERVESRIEKRSASPESWIALKRSLCGVTSLGLAGRVSWIGVRYIPVCRVSRRYGSVRVAGGLEGSGEGFGGKRLMLGYFSYHTLCQIVFLMEFRTSGK